MDTLDRIPTWVLVTGLTLLITFTFLMIPVVYN
jgi:hypothetical protein